jgi:hypothetical protein
MPPRTIMVVMRSHLLTEAHEASGEHEKKQDDHQEEGIHVKPPVCAATPGVSLWFASILQHNTATKPRSRGPKSAFPAKTMLPRGLAVRYPS